VIRLRERALFQASASRMLGKAINQWERSMGTRNLTCVFFGGEYKVAQYGQWDGYPSGQGETILTFLREKFDRQKFLDRLATVFEPTKEQIVQWWADVGHDIEASSLVSIDKSDAFAKLHPSLDRDVAGKVLALIQDSGEPVPLHSSLSFAADSLFCEWAYVVDLDKNTFEVFEGFNKELLAEGERFASLPLEAGAEYHPVKLVASFPLDALPTVEAFLVQLEPAEEEEEAA
jgi:hypothetical protein